MENLFRASGRDDLLRPAVRHYKLLARGGEEVGSGEINEE